VVTKNQTNSAHYGLAKASCLKKSLLRLLLLLLKTHERPTTKEDAALLAAGWERKERNDNSFWVQPGTGYSYSRDLALSYVRVEKALKVCRDYTKPANVARLVLRGDVPPNTLAVSLANHYGERTGIRG